MKTEPGCLAGSLGGNFPSNHACRTALRMNQARNRTAGDTLFKRIASPAHVIWRLQCVVLSRSLHVKALEFAAFVVRAWENTTYLINPWVFKLERGLHVKMLDSAPFTVRL